MTRAEERIVNIIATIGVIVLVLAGLMVCSLLGKATVGNEVYDKQGNLLYVIED